jgi:hypothetical protein
MVVVFFLITKLVPQGHLPSPPMKNSWKSSMHLVRLSARIHTYNELMAALILSLPAPIILMMSPQVLYILHPPGHRSNQTIFSRLLPRKRFLFLLIHRRKKRRRILGKGDQSPPRILVGSSQKKSARCIKERRGTVRMVVRDDIPIREVPQLVGKTLVGIFNGKSLGEKSLTGWMNNLCGNP